jgi:hypothetical protein
MKGGWLIPVVLVGTMAGDFGRELNRWSHSFYYPGRDPSKTMPVRSGYLLRWLHLSGKGALVHQEDCFESLRKDKLFLQYGCRLYHKHRKRWLIHNRLR